MIREKNTGEVVMETRDRAKVDALNTERYEAVPVRQHLADLNRDTPAARAAGQEAPTERTEAGEQAVIPGAEQDATRSERARESDQRREMEARQRQSRMGTTEPQDGPGGLFDTQGDLLDSADSTPDKPAVVREWENAENAAYEASSEWNRVREAYRAGNIGDAEFQAAREKHQAALDRADAARTKLDGSRYEAEISPDAARTVTWCDTTAKAANPDSAQGDMLDQAAASPERTDQEGTTAKDEWRIVRTDDPDPANRFKVMRRKGDNQKDACPTCSTTRTP